MKTEIKGDFIGYMKRFKMPSGKAFLYPLKTMLIAFVVQLIVVLILWFIPLRPLLKIVPIFAFMMFTVSFYIKVHYKLFWNVVLEESKGLIPDLLMWLYYIVIGMISISPSYIGLIHFMS